MICAIESLAKEGERRILNPELRSRIGQKLPLTDRQGLVLNRSDGVPDYRSEHILMVSRCRHISIDINCEHLGTMPSHMSYMSDIRMER